MQVEYFEYIIVGSGPSGTMAAQTLVEAGKNVAMIDVGFTGKDYEAMLPEGDFNTIRQSDPNQYRYLLGDKFESVFWGGVKVGAQLTPARKHLIKDVEKIIPLISDSFSPMESLAYGGLGSGWGLGSYVYSDLELKRSGLNTSRMKESYQIISDRIGISSNINDDVSRYVTGTLKNMQPPLKIDNSTKIMFETYTRKQKSFNRRGVYLGHPSMALLSEPFNDREGAKYHDLDFYSDRDQSAYRPWITLNKLRIRQNFTYLNNLLVLEFSEGESEISIVVKNVMTLEHRVIKCRKLLLAAGALGSARIVLRSYKGELDKLPVLCNPYIYMPCVHIRMLGGVLSGAKTSMAQAFMIYDEAGGGDDLVSMAIYTYRSLMLYNLVKETPLNFADGLRIIKYLQSSFMIVGIHHPDSFSENKYVKLLPKEDSFTGDALFAHYELNDLELGVIARREKKIRGFFRELGCYPIKRLQPTFGASIHYAGTLPFNSDDRFGTTHPDGRLNKTKNVFIADGSGYNYLPAKGITLTLMANAYLVALESMK